ncbi:uncharacterized protein LOC144619395 [Crassostrea virginica]
MEFAQKDTSRFDDIKNDLEYIRQQDDLLLQNLLQISRTIHRAAESRKPATRNNFGRTFICRHGHRNCLGYHRNKEAMILEENFIPSRHLSESLRNLKEITSSLEDVCLSEHAHNSSSEHLDSD